MNFGGILFNPIHIYQYGSQDFTFSEELYYNRGYAIKSQVSRRWQVGMWQVKDKAFGVEYIELA